MLSLLTIVLLLLLFAFTYYRVPEIDTEFGGATVHISSDRGFVITPGGCAQIRWSVEGIRSIYIDGAGRIGMDEESYCPSADASGPQIEITAQDGTTRTYVLDILNFHTPYLFMYLLLLSLALIVLIVLYYVVVQQLDEAPPVRLFLLIVLIFLVLAGQMLISGNIRLIYRFLAVTRDFFVDPSWQLFGLVLAALVFAPLTVQALNRAIKSRATADLVAIAAFFVFLLVLYLPFGFDSVGHWEEWVVNAYFEGRPSKLGTELIARFWVLVPHALAYLMSSDSFVGYHLVNFLMFWGKLVLLYGILRHLRFPRVYAFLTTLLFMVYPANSDLMSLRSFPMQFSMLSLLAAVYLMLDYLKQPRRLLLLGIWLALLFNVGSNESAYVLVFIVPVFWWWRDRRLTWRNSHLTAIWYLIPVAKIIYLALLLTAERRFYGTIAIAEVQAEYESVSELLGIVFNALVGIYQHTFIDAWHSAMTAMGHGRWFVLALVMMALIAVASVYLSRFQDSKDVPSSSEAIRMVLLGTLFVAPAVGVLIWLGRYRGDLWRMYFYVPIFAAVAVFGLIVLLTMILRHTRYRQLVIVVMLMILMIPSLTRLLRQHEYFVDSAYAKAHILLQMAQQAPKIEDNAFVILLTDMSQEEFYLTNTFELETNMLDSAYYSIYRGSGPKYAFLCSISKRCYPNDNALEEFHFGRVSERSNLVIFRLHDDMTVELLRELPPELSITDADQYDPDRLIDASAPLPPRALTMLGSTSGTQ